MTKAEKITKGKYSALATWKNYICLGHESGKLEIFKDNLDSPIESNSELHMKYITVIKFSEKFLITCSNSGSLVVTKKQSLELYRRLGGHSERINSIDFNPNNELEIVTGSLDGTCQIWNIETSQPIANFDSSSPASSPSSSAAPLRLPHWAIPARLARPRPARPGPNWLRAAGCDWRGNPILVFCLCHHNVQLDCPLNLLL